MKITYIRGSSDHYARDQLLSELKIVTDKLENAIANLQFYKDFEDHNLTLMWMDQTEYLIEKAKELLWRLGL